MLALLMALSVQRLNAMGNRAIALIRELEIRFAEVCIRRTECQCVLFVSSVKRIRYENDENSTE